MSFSHNEFKLNRLYAALLATGMLLTPLAAQAVSNIGAGAYGVAGVDGSPGNPATSGGDGGDGEANSTDAGYAEANRDSSNLAISYGGNGGDGGAGGNANADGAVAGNGGNGGKGGDATATAATSVSGSVDGSATATALAGYGGMAGLGGSAGAVALTVWRERAATPIPASASLAAAQEQLPPMGLPMVVVVDAAMHSAMRVTAVRRPVAARA